MLSFIPSHPYPVCFFMTVSAFHAFFGCRFTNRQITIPSAKERTQTDELRARLSRSAQLNALGEVRNGGQYFCGSDIKRGMAASKIHRSLARIYSRKSGRKVVDFT